MLNVHVLYEHSADQRPHGCSYIRLLLPLRHTANVSQIDLTEGLTYSGHADVVCVERFWKPATITLEQAQQLVHRVRRDKAKLIYTLDDNLLDWRAWSLTQAEFAAHLKPIARYLARAADGVIVSTEPLQARLQRLNARVVVVPNALDERLFKTEDAPPPNARIVIGYMGTFSHDADFMLILQALRAVLRRHRDEVELQLVGSIADPAILHALDGLPVQTLSGYPVAYPDFARWMARALRWDIAIAPLEDTSFTRCKSDIKFLDYSALGFAGIYSRMPVYERTVRHLETGYLAENTVAGWTEALERLITDAALRQTLAHNARDYVWNNRMLAQCAPQWVAAFHQLCANH